MKRLLSALAVSAGLCASAFAQGNAPPLQCPDDVLDQVRRTKPVPGLFTALAPPLAVFNALARDPLAKLPSRAISVRVVDAAGRAVPNAMVAFIYREGKRFLAEGTAGGAPIRLPHGRYIVNAALLGKDRSMRYGSVETVVDAKSPAAVTVKLTGTTAVVAGAAPQTAPIGSNVEVELSGDIRMSTVLAVVRHGANARAEPTLEDNIIISQTQVYEDQDKPAVGLPDTIGKYDVVAMLCAPRIPLARWTVATTPARVAIEAPARVPMGSALRGAIVGTLSSAYTIAVAEAGKDPVVADYPRDPARHALELKLPNRPGRYELTVATGDKLVLARHAFEIEAGELPITGPDKIWLGDFASFSWPHAGEEGFRLEVWTLPSAGRPAKRIARLQQRMSRSFGPPGEHELRLVSQSSGDERVYGRKRFQIQGRVFGEVPTETLTNHFVKGRTTIPIETWDRIVFVRRGAEVSGEGRELEKTPDPRFFMTLSPASPGSYDMVYLMGAPPSELVEAGRVPIEVR
jgi:hypothetical protein